jgi:hypothetical protein
MKPIDQMNLAECLDALRMETLPLDENWSFATFSRQDRIQLADRIHELTRWILVSERMPTEEDGDKWGEVLVCYRGEEVQCDLVINVNGVQHSNKDITHWRRIDLPEAKP